jgi:hypothetical protein
VVLNYLSVELLVFSVGWLQVVVSVRYWVLVLVLNVGIVNCWC